MIVTTNTTTLVLRYVCVDSSCPIEVKPFFPTQSGLKSSK